MKKKSLMKSLTALVLSVLMVLSLAACGAKPSDGGKNGDKDGYTVAIIKQMDHASLDEIADAIAARLDAIAQEQNVSIHYTITSGQGGSVGAEAAGGSGRGRSGGCHHSHRHHRRSGVRRGG